MPVLQTDRRSGIPLAAICSPTSQSDARVTRAARSADTSPIYAECVYRTWVPDAEEKENLDVSPRSPPGLPLAVGDEVDGVYLPGRIRGIERRRRSVGKDAASQTDSRNPASQTVGGEVCVVALPDEVGGEGEDDVAVDRVGHGCGGFATMRRDSRTPWSRRSFLRTSGSGTRESPSQA